ncbi:MAG: Hsp20/alpha crystallin family protein [Desulfobulbaceae bacterium]|nr:Hsp20/alpha crystallin family protein [Desulfobulbaceae bacterium]
MARKKEKKEPEKAELVTKEETRPGRPETSFGELEDYFNRLFRQPFSMMGRPSWSLGTFPKFGEQLSPSVDIFEEDGDMVVKAEIPGISKEDLNVSITEDTLTLSGEKKQEEKVERKDYHRVERSYGSFSRCFRLPDNVNGEKAKASFKDGVLEIRIPKTKETKAKKIQIS